MMCAKDLRACSCADGDGLTEPAQEVGATFGHASATDVLPHRSTVAQSAVEQRACAMTMELWTNDFKKIHYLAVTAHYIDNEWRLINNVLIMKRFPDGRKSVNNIREELQNHLTERGIVGEVSQNVAFVADRGPNMKKALDVYARSFVLRTPRVFVSVRVVAKSHQLTEEWSFGRTSELEHTESRCPIRAPSTTISLGCLG
ncbi:hypothetical protein PR048_007746 [Dryococelus australis]|uniref:Uncharacterized protein n=1 Tax=Dryococelus australis TaxID=614101 RepID=A0ABQ9HV47_9NEOP|nr:hypothetical protein PR048_007746 [Dryococelus australis]